MELIRDMYNKKLEYKKIIDKIEQLHKKKCLPSGMYKKMKHGFENFDWNNEDGYKIDVEKVLAHLDLFEKTEILN